MHMILNGKLLEEVDCFKFLWWHISVDRGCERDVIHRINERYRACIHRKVCRVIEDLG